MTKIIITICSNNALIFLSVINNENLLRPIYYILNSLRYEKLTVSMQSKCWNLSFTSTDNNAKSELNLMILIFNIALI